MATNINVFELVKDGHQVVKLKNNKMEKQHYPLGGSVIKFDEESLLYQNQLLGLSSYIK